jgi:signal peptidase
MRVRHWIAWGILVFLTFGIGGVAFGFHAAGYEKYIVETGSMVPELNPGDLVIDRPAKDGYKVGDVITFRHGEGADLVTHRVIDITPDGIKTKGDANRTADVWTIPQDLVQGVVAFNIPKGGFVVLFLSQPAGIGAVLLAIVCLVLLWRLFFPTDTANGKEPEGAARVDGDSVSDGPPTASAAGPQPDDPATLTSEATGAPNVSSSAPTGGRHVAP